MVHLEQVIPEGMIKIIRKKFPSVVSYIERYYIADDEEGIYGFDFAKNDNARTVTMRNSHCVPHSMEHLNRDESWAHLKKNAQYNSTNKPSWFESDEDASLNLEELFMRESSFPELERIERWANDRDIYYNDPSYSRLSIRIPAKYPGLCLDKEIRNMDFVRIVLEYTEFHEDGEFVIYTLYPCD